MSAAEKFPDKRQPLEEGVGPVFHRRYRVELSTDMASARRAMRQLKADINSFSPQWLAKFEKTKGRRHSLYRTPTTAYPTKASRSRSR